MIEWMLSFLPPYPQVVSYTLVSAAAILLSGTLCGALKRFAGWKTGYTRKTLHFLIFFTAVGLHLHGGMPAVNILGLGMGIFVFLAVWAGEGNLYFEAMAREKDSPRRGYFVVVPYLTTAFGGLASNLFFGQSAVMGYALCGAADAIAEPVGVRFGRHKYSVPSLRKVRAAERSLEGSLAVFLVTVILSAAFFAGFHRLPLLQALVSSLVMAAAVTSVEAVSFHGADNLSIQVAASGLAFFFLRTWG